MNDPYQKTGALLHDAAQAERMAKRERFKDGDAIKDRSGTRYTMRNVQHRGLTGVAMTLEREWPKRDKSMSPRQWRNKAKADRRLEKQRRERFLEAARKADRDLTSTVEYHAGDADIVDMPR